MNTRKLHWQALAASAILASALPGLVHAADGGSGSVTVANPKSIQWGEAPPTLPKGAKAAILSGDPEQAGLTTIRLSAPAGYKIGPHTHPRTEYLTVISGTLHYGMGEKADPAKTQAIAAGGFHAVPANTPHYVYVKTPTVVQVHFEGPFDIKYLNPADDPANAKAK